MAKIIGSVFGKLRGRLGPFVCSYGRYGNRISFCPRQRNPRTIKQTNIRHVVRFVISVYKLLSSEIKHLIYMYIRNSKLNITSYLVKLNAGLLYNSIPDKSLPISASNPFNLLHFRFFTGSLEAATIEDISYECGKLKLRWSCLGLTRSRDKSDWEGDFSDRGYIIVLGFSDYNKFTDLSVFCSSSIERGALFVELDLGDKFSNFNDIYVYLFFHRSLWFSKTISSKLSIK